MPVMTIIGLVATFGCIALMGVAPKWMRTFLGFGIAMGIYAIFWDASMWLLSNAFEGWRRLPRLLAVGAVATAYSAALLYGAGWLLDGAKKLIVRPR